MAENNLQTPQNISQLPAVSIIIPMYNAEQFIKSCIKSAQRQTLQNIEIICVDDCSTDNTFNIVSEMAKQDSRIRLARLRQNSGGASEPRNYGMRLSRGKYIAFLDSDDMYTKTAMEELTNIAEKFQADVVHMEKSLTFNDNGKNKFHCEDLTLQKYETGEPIEVPTLESQDLRERTRGLIEGRFLWITLGKLYRRDFVTKNKIEFLNLSLAEDLFFWYKCFCLAKNYVRAPQVTNIYRRGHNSASQKIISSEKGVKLWLNTCTNNISAIAELTSGLEFFKSNPETRRNVLKFFIDKHFDMIKNLFQGLEPHEVQKIFYDELQNPELDSKGKELVAAYLYAERALTR